MRKMRTGLRTRFPSVAVAAMGLVAAVLLSGLFSSEPHGAYGYRKYHYKKPSYKKYIAYCKRTSCSEAKSCKVCAKRDVKASMQECRLTFGSEKADCTDASCVHTAKSHLKTCGQAARGQMKADLAKCVHGGQACNHCCKYSKGQNDCSGYFDGTKHPGSYKYHGQPVCPNPPPASPSGAFVEQVRTLVQFVVGCWTNRATVSSNGTT